MDISNKRGFQSPFTDAELIAISEEVSSCFPGPMSDSLITLMEVDPYTIHAYWNIEPSRIENILDSPRDDAPKGSLNLRVYTTLSDAQTSDDGFFDSEIPGTQSSVYINVTPQVSYVAEIGLLYPDGDFFVLAKSNEVVTPPDYKAPGKPIPPQRQDGRAGTSHSRDESNNEAGRLFQSSYFG